MLLYPDPRIGEQPDNLTTCFSVPIDVCEWEHLKAIADGTGDEDAIDGLNAMRFVTLEDDIYFMRSTGEDGYDKLVILLRENEDADTCLESAAWIRVRHEYNGMIYICRKSTTADAWQSFAAIAAANVDEALVAMVDLDKDEGEFL